MFLTYMQLSSCYLGGWLPGDR